MKRTKVLLLLLTLLAAYLGWRQRQAVTAAARWSAAVDSLHARNDSLLAATDSLASRQFALTLALDSGAVDRAQLVDKTINLSTQIARMRQVLPVVIPDTCAPWVALSDTLSVALDVATQRATLAENDVLRANTGRLDALAHAGALASRLRTTDSLLLAHPPVTPPFLSLLLDARIGSDGRASGVVALRRGGVYAGVGVGVGYVAVVGYRADLRIF